MAKRLACALACALSVVPAAAATIERPAAARIIIIDGDTFVLPGGERIRLQDIDAPETRKARCKRELVLGLRAKERLAQLMRSGPVEVDRTGRDWFHRTLAIVKVGGASVGAMLVREGLALPWRKGAKARAARAAAWCSP